MKKAFLIVGVLGLLSAGTAGTVKAATSTTWTNGGGSYCLPILTVNGAPSTGNFYCPDQSSSFVLPDGGASLYLGNIILEVNRADIVRGNPVVTSYNANGSIAAYSETDTFSAYGYSVETTQNFTRTYAVRCARYGCHKYSYDTNVGGNGTVTQ